MKREPTKGASMGHATSHIPTGAHLPRTGNLPRVSLQVLLLLAVVAGISVLVAQASDSGGSSPGTGAAAPDAPDVVVTGLPGVDLTPLTRLPGLAAASGPYWNVQTSIRHGGTEIAVRAEARSTGWAAAGAPRLLAGAWPGRMEDGMVVEKRLASKLNVRSGDRVLMTSVDGRIPVPISAVVAASEPTTVYMRPRLLSAIAPSDSTHGSSISLRLDDSGRAPEYRRWIQHRFPGGQVTVTVP
jgi:hypothetical protein